MITLGLNAVFHDSAAALVVDGVVVAAAEEERFTRTKHAKRPLPFTAWELPFHAIAWCLQQAGIGLGDLDHVAYSFDPWRFAEGRSDLPLHQDTCLPLPTSPEHARLATRAPWDSPWDPLFVALVLHAPGQLADGAPHHLRGALRGPAPRPQAWQWHFLDHHLCHQASAFLAAPRDRFERCAVLTLDGRGERATTSFGVWRDGRYRSLGEVPMPHSLGLLYERVTTHLGFLHSSDEYKVMALAAMGRPRWADAIGAQVQVLDDGQLRIGAIDLEAIAGPPRVPGTPLRPEHLDLAASLQQVLEERVITLARWLRRASGERALAMAGGVALNCVMNAKLRDAGCFDALWVQPAAGDAGTALGAALWTDARARPHAPDAGGAGQALAERRWQMDHVQLGPEWDDEAIGALLRWSGLEAERFDDPAALCERTARLLAEDQIIGWFQGRMEWGPRALGSRSILASPVSPRMQARLNDLKDREDFRPVAPAITEEDFADWFTPAQANGGTSPFMLFTHQVRPALADRIPAACHSDGSARVQTVGAAAQPRLHALLQAFARITGVPVLVNTSFNVRGEPIVCSPQQALQAFYSTPLDALVIGCHVLCKRAARRAAT